MSLGHKKVILRKRNRDWFSGYLPPTGFADEGKVSLLEPAGKVISLELRDVKWICFVRDFQSGDSSDPERLIRRSFSSRPRSEGLWLKLHIIDDEVALEGLAANNLTLLNPHGLFITPPDTRSNTQRIFIPHSSLESMEILGVIGAAPRRKAGAPEAQADLFREEVGSED
jgi:hypothetical protein